MGKYEEYSQWFSQDYEQPVVDDYIVGFSGLDPDKKVKPELINHEKLDGLLGGDFAGRYHLTQDQVSKLIGYQDEIDTVREDAETKIARIKSEALTAIGAVDKRLSYVRENLDGRMTEVEQSQSELETSQESISTRFEAILEGATEDTEILDARVDARNQIHPNLGHNIRNLHRLILGSENNNEKERLQNEKALQEQINTISFTIMHWVVSDSEARERINARISNLQQTLNDINQSLSEIYDALADTGAMTYKGAKIAASYEVGDMLKDILAGTDDGEICVSEIPDEVKDEIAGHEEITAFLNEFFTNRS